MICWFDLHLRATVDLTLFYPQSTSFVIAANIRISSATICLYVRRIYAVPQRACLTLHMQHSRCPENKAGIYNYATPPSPVR